MGSNFKLRIKPMPSTTKEFLLSLCEDIYRAEREAERTRHKRSEGIFEIKLLIMEQDKIRVEIRKENGSHNEPHLHISHTDKFDASLSLKDFRVLTGNIDPRTKKHILRVLEPVRPRLMDIWGALNKQDNTAGAEKLICELFISSNQ